jgi:hypothetical protein
MRESQRRYSCIREVFVDGHFQDSAATAWGETLTETGLDVTMEKAPESRLLFYASPAR